MTDIFSGADGVEGWQTDDWRSYRAWTDRVTIAIRFLADDRETVMEEWGLTVDAVDDPPEQDELIWAVDALGRRPGGEPTYILTVNETKRSWGADGAALSIVLDIAQDMVSNALWVGLGAIGARIIGKKRADHQSSVASMTDEEIEQSARDFLMERYSIRDEAEVHLVGLENDGPNGSATFDRPALRRRYTVGVTREPGDVLRYRVRWEATEH